MKMNMSNKTTWQQIASMGMRCRFLLLVALMLAAYGVGAQNYYVFYHTSGGYLQNNNGTLNMTTTFNPRTIWNASANIEGGNSNNSSYRGTVRSYFNDAQYLQYTSNGRAPALGSSTSSNIDRWGTYELLSQRRFHYYTGTNNNGTRYYLQYRNGALTFNNSTSTNSGSNNYNGNKLIALPITITNYPLVNNTTAPTISATYLTGTNTIQMNHTDVVGTYQPACSSAQVQYYNNQNNRPTYYWLSGATTTSAIRPSANWANATYTWSIASGGAYAGINPNTGVLALNNNNVPTTTQNITVRLTTTHEYGYSDVADYTITITPMGAQQTPTHPTVAAAMSADNAGVQMSHTNVTGTFSDTYYQLSSTAGIRYWDGATNITTTPSYTTNSSWGNAVYTWSITSGANYATINAAGILTARGNLVGQNNVTVRLTTTHTCGYSHTADYPVVIEGHAATLPTATVSGRSDLDFVGDNAQLTGTVNGSYTPPCTDYYFASTHHYVRGNTLLGGLPTPVASGFTSSWHLSGEGAANAAIDGHGRITYLTDPGTDQHVLVEYTVGHTSYPELNVSATPHTITLLTANLAPPTLTRNGSDAEVYITAANGCYIYYTTDGSDPLTSATRVAYTVNPVALTTSPTTIKAVAMRGSSTSAVVEQTYRLPLNTPTVTIDDNGNVTIALAGAPAGTQYRYTTDGSTPTESSTLYDGTFQVSNLITVNAIAVNANYMPSAVGSATYMISSGVMGGRVILNDYEDHHWTYYSGVDAAVDGGNYNTNYIGKIYSPNPRNVKITYNATQGAAVSGTEPETTFVYFKTLEEDAATGTYPYQVISSPFSKRPRIGNTYYGFAGWKVVSGASHIRRANGTTAQPNDVLSLDEEIAFINLDNGYTPNCTSAEIVFETTWETATVHVLSVIDQWTIYEVLDNNGANTTYENNFLLIQGVSISNRIRANYPVTITMVTPDGANDYRNTSSFTGYITPNNDGVTKIEYSNWTGGNNSTVTCDYNSFYIGRGVTTTGVCANYIRGIGSATAVNDPQYTLKIESGRFNYVSFYRGYYTSGGNGTDDDSTPYTVTGSNANVRVFFGNDYDRATNNNSNLEIRYGPILGSSGSFSTAANRDNEHTVDLVIKSGQIGSTFFVENTNNSAYLQGGAGQCIYMSNAAAHTNMGRRNVLIEGGDVCAVGCGIDQANNTALANGATTTNSATNLGRTGFTFRMKGGTIHGNVYGGAAKSPSGGNKVLVMTGGTVKGWLAAGCNGTDNDGGQNFGTSYVYIGGNGQVNSDGNNATLGYANGGSVYAAGAGRSGSSSCGEMTFGTNLAIADNSYVERGIYGGGNYGYAMTNSYSNIYITGGTNGGISDVANNTTSVGGVFGGANRQDGPNVNIYMTGGIMKGGVHGGCNTDGDIYGSVNMKILGGQVGTSTSATANVHGGGYGIQTSVRQNVDIVLGNEGQTTDGVTVYGDVYGGSALGKTNGGNDGTTVSNTNHTNVTLNKGIIYGSLYGGALGSNSVAANVYAPVAVVVNGGSVRRVAGNDGSGGVYGGNNINGSPLRSVTVDIYGTDSAPGTDYALYAVYGGGNRANYTYGNGYPKVTVHNCDNSIEYLFGGGNAAAVASTDVTVYGGNVIGNVFGGGNGTVSPANVTGNVNTKIYGGIIRNVYGGSNMQGTIGGTITLTIDKNQGIGHGNCTMRLGDVYGGGNQSASNAGNINLVCADSIDNIYGGAKNANITGNITLNIYSGIIGKAFGGNNIGGNVSGTMTVNVEENACGGIHIGELYGGGNNASYGYMGNYPAVNVKSWHTIGTCYGGGRGVDATVSGNPQVKIDPLMSGNVATSNHHSGTVGTVFGGGNAAAVSGSTSVYVNNSSVLQNVYGGGNAAPVNGNTNVDLTGNTTVGGNVYGGGNEGAVGGNTNVRLH